MRKIVHGQGQLYTVPALLPFGYYHPGVIYQPVEPVVAGTNLFDQGADLF